MTRSEPLAALAPVVELLERLGVRYYLGGSFASSIYGVARTTADADLVAEIGNQHVRPFVEALRAEYYVSEPMIQGAIRAESCFNLIHLATSFKVDIFVARTNAFRLSALTRVIRDTLGETDPLTINVASPEDVVLAKLHWYRAGGETSERQWSDILGVLRLQADRLDWEYLHFWAANLRVADLLTKIASEAKAGGM